jgi:hypothetical protein
MTWQFPFKAGREWFWRTQTQVRPLMFATGERPMRSWSRQAVYRQANRKLWGRLYFSPVRR